MRKLKSFTAAIRLLLQSAQKIIAKIEICGQKNGMGILKSLIAHLTDENRFFFKSCYVKAHRGTLNIKSKESK
jgi:hypothetical protein